MIRNKLANTMQRKDRFVEVKAITEDHMVLYDAYENTDLVAANCIRPLSKFEEEYDL